jgi:hypothetical protein
MSVAAIEHMAGSSFWALSLSLSLTHTHSHTYTSFMLHAAAVCRYGADLDAVSPKGWTPLSYAKAHGKYGPTEEAGIYPEVRQPVGCGNGAVDLTLLHS